MSLTKRLSDCLCQKPNPWSFDHGSDALPIRPSKLPYSAIICASLALSISDPYTDSWRRIANVKVGRLYPTCFQADNNKVGKLLKATCKHCKFQDAASMINQANPETGNRIYLPFLCRWWLQEEGRLLPFSTQSRSTTQTRTVGKFMVNMGSNLTTDAPPPLWMLAQ